MCIDQGESVTYIGIGAIGSHAVGAIVRNTRLKRITIVDPDRYEHRNLTSQDIVARDLGRLKVEVLAARIQRIAPALRVEAIAESVERVPLGRLRASVIATGLDGLASRRWVSRAAWRLGVPWVDAGVRAGDQLARVDIYEPSSDTACLECGWSDQERAALDNVYPCDPPLRPAPTGTPAYLGQLAASLQCKECEKFLAGDPRPPRSGHQLLMDAATDRCCVSTRARSPDCAFDHRSWSIRPLPRSPGTVTLQQALRLLPVAAGERPRLRVHGDLFVRRFLCPNCSTSRRLLYLASRIEDEFRLCPRCGDTMVAPGIDTTDSLTSDHPDRLHRRLSLYAVGLRAGDVFSIETSSGEVHFEIGGR